MKHLLIRSVFVLAAVGQDIQHAPTVAQCQADQRLWLSTIEEGDSPKLPSSYVLSNWSREMDDCEKVDPNNRVKYYNTTAEIDVTVENRYMHFIDRHGLWQQFIAEDAAGKR